MPRHTCMPSATCCPRLTLKEQSRGVGEEKEPGGGWTRAGSDRTIPSRHFLRSRRTSTAAHSAPSPARSHRSHPFAARPGGLRSRRGARVGGTERGDRQPAVLPGTETPQLAGDRLLRGSYGPAPSSPPHNSSPGPTYMVLAKGGGG